MKLRILSREDVQQAVSMARAIEAVKGAFAQLSAGRANVPLRTQLFVPKHQGVTIMMPAYLEENDSLAVKIVSVFPNNPALGLPTTQALVLVVDAATGLPTAAMDGTFLTALRTGAASGAATDLLARQDARTVAILGAGAQGRTQLLGVCEARPVERVRVFDQVRARSEQYATEMQRVGGRIPVDITVADTAREAVADADVICTATTSTTALFRDADLKPGVHINAIGAYTPQMQEIDEATVARARIVVDSCPACLAEAGDVIIPLRKGLILESSLSELGEIVLGRKPGRQDEREVTFFKTVGVAVQDAAVARLALLIAKERGLGIEVEL
jgi:ornithine cyclodeaminase/alanine dehydrogenase-like protein (mu-crystallin family)